jgi:nicotinate-nucleotide--dimethylbenzimidazole phosphoribosyltransferase
VELEEIIAGIPEIPTERYRAARQHWDTLAKPLGSLGVLEENVTKIAALSGKRQLSRRTLLVFCSDNGVVAQGVSQSDASVTTAVAAALGRGDSTVNFMAKTANCTVLPVDIGMLEPTPPGVQKEKRMPGTHDITLGPAMTRETCIRVIETGFRLAEQQIKNGADILLLGEMGIGNTTTSAAVASVLLHQSPEELTGRGAGLSSDGLQRKIHAIDRAIQKNQPNPEDPIDVLSKIGGLDLAALCGVCLCGAKNQVPVLLDGVITNTAALCAVRLCPAVQGALIASHVSQEPAAKLLLAALALQPCISAGLHLGEGSGAVLALPMLDQALAVYNSGHTFDALGINAYVPQ